MSFIRQAAARAALQAAALEVFQLMAEEAGEGATEHADSLLVNLQIDRQSEDFTGIVALCDGELVIMEQSL